MKINLLTKLFLLLIVFFTIFGFLLSIFIYNYPENKISESLKKQLPISIKSFIRDTVFIVQEKIPRVEPMSINVLSKLRSNEDM